MSFPKFSVESDAFTSQLSSAYLPSSIDVKLHMSYKVEYKQKG